MNGEPATISPTLLRIQFHPENSNINGDGLSLGWRELRRQIYVSTECAISHRHVRLPYLRKSASLRVWSKSLSLQTSSEISLTRIFLASKVGVYFAFKDDSCFCAHINPVINVHPGKYARIPHSDEGEKLKDLVYSLLKHNCGSASNLKLDREVVVVCPQMYEDKWGSDPAKWVKLVGWHTVEGIKAWLADDQESPKAFVCDESSQGFVVDHRDGKVAKIPKSVSCDEVVGGVTVGGWHVVPEEISLAGQKWEPAVQRETDQRDAE